MAKVPRSVSRFAQSFAPALLLVAVGCGKMDVPQTKPPLADGPSTSVDRPPVPITVAASRPNETRPTTPQAFVEEFKRRFDEDFYSAFVELAYWDGTSEDHRRDYMIAVQGLATHPVNGSVGRLDPEIEVHDAAGYDYAFFPTEGDEEVQAYPAPTHILEVTTLFGEDGSLKQTNYFAIGEHDGKYYFSTIKPE